MSQRPKRGGGKTPRDGDATPPGSLRARDGGGTHDISQDFVDSGQDDTDLVETRGHETPGAFCCMLGMYHHLCTSEMLDMVLHTCIHAYITWIT